MGKRDEKAGLLTGILFVIYLAALVWIILFKMALSPEQLSHLRSINLIPYGSSAIVNGKLDVTELFYNVLAFVPLGIYLSMIMSKKGFLKKVAMIAGVSLLLEVLQYILAVGTSDITDLINNTIGGIIGVLIYLFLYFLLGRRTNKFLKKVALICTVLMICLIAVLIFSNL